VVENSICERGYYGCNSAGQAATRGPRGVTIQSGYGGYTRLTSVVSFAWNRTEKSVAGANIEVARTDFELRHPRD
jgi:hypothetical protein